MTTTRTAPGRGDRHPRRGRSRLGREVAIVLLVKALALLAIWHLWFSASSRPHVDGLEVAARVYSSQAASAPAKERHARP